MAIRRGLRFGAFAFIIIAVMLLLSPEASAKVTALITVDKAGVYYEYPYEPLLDSYAYHCLDYPASLFDDYMSKGMAMFLDDKNGYVDYEAALDEYATCIVKGKPFNLDAYTSGPDAKLVYVPKVKVVTYENGQLVYTDKDIAHPLEVALYDINTAADAIALRLALEGKAKVMELDTSLYNTLTFAAKNAVAEGVFLRRGEGFPDIVSVKAVFAEEVDRVTAELDAILTSINAASSVDELSPLLLDNGPILELELDCYSMIISTRSRWALSQVFDSLPFDSVIAVRDCFNNAVAGTLKSYVIVSYTPYQHTLTQVLDIQMTRNPQWYVSGVGWTKAPREEVLRYLDPNNFVLTDLANYVSEVIISTNSLHVRSIPSTEGESLMLVEKGQIFPVEEVQSALAGTAAGTEGCWFRITAGEHSGWICGKYADWVADTYSPAMFQFLALAGKSGVTVSDLGIILNGKGILHGMEAVFFQASRSNNINEIFLASLALHESGNGTSTLANGVLFTPEDKSLPPRVVYNMFGIGAVDSNPIYKGAEYAYNHGWFSPEEAIIGGAYFASRYYVHNSNHYQNTLYKMRWNPVKPGQHQYATDIGWASKQTSYIRQLYAQVKMYNLKFDIPMYAPE